MSTARVLVLGATGMLGHKVMQQLAPRLTVVGAVRRRDGQTRAIEKLSGARVIDGLDATRPESLVPILDHALPQVVVNCVGIIKQREGQSDSEDMVRVNALFPHLVERECVARGVRLIHLSTDCVFSGDRGGYEESDRPDPVDVYGQSKLLGEVAGPNVLTVRTSMIGRELRGGHSLLEWFLRQPGPDVRGFTRAIFSGLTNIALAREIGRIITDVPGACGLYHVSAAPIAKHSLLEKLASAFARPIRVIPDAAFHCDRSLVSTKYQDATGFIPPDWDAMIGDLAADPTPYAELQRLAE